jgi:hypothetical protein
VVRLPDTGKYQNAAMNGDPVMKRSLTPVFCIVLTLLLLCIILVPFVSAAKATATPKLTPAPTVPAVLQACSQARVPAAHFTCNFPADNSSAVPDGPPFTIKCFDNSSTEFNQSIVSWRWDFGDGGSSTDQNPEHTFSDASRYDIRLTVVTFCGSQYSNTSLDSLNIYCSVPVAGFTTNVSEGYAPLAVGVTDTSLRTQADITRWTYWFDNNHSSTERNPVFVYPVPGTYTINQSVWKDCVQIGSSFYPPTSRQIKVNPPPTGPAGNATNVTPAAGKTGGAPAESAPPVTPVETPRALPATPVYTGAPGTGELSVTTEPSGAQIFLDDALKGSSPVTLQNIPAGSHSLRFVKEGYTTMTIPVVRITEGEKTTFGTTLMPETGGVAVLPVIVLSLIIIGILVGGAYLYLKQRAESLED